MYIEVPDQIIECSKCECRDYDTEHDGQIVYAICRECGNKGIERILPTPPDVQASEELKKIYESSNIRKF